MPPQAASSKAETTVRSAAAPRSGHLAPIRGVSSPVTAALATSGAESRNPERTAGRCSSR